MQSGPVGQGPEMSSQSFADVADRAILERGPDNPFRNRVLRYLVSVMDHDWRASPGFRAICEAMPDIEPQNVDYALRTLVVKGWLVRERPDRVRDAEGRLLPRGRDVYAVQSAKLAGIMRPVGQAVAK